MFFLLSYKFSNIYSNKGNFSNNPFNFLDLGNNNKGNFCSNPYNLKRGIILKAELIFIKGGFVKIKRNNISIFNSE